ncbi:MAG: helix-turn-helix domain-containing protein [Polyangiaceae bacterium]
MGRNKTVDDEQLIGVARQVFRTRGHGAGTRDIAQAAGISQAVLYQRFGSKEELFLRAMTPELPDVEALLGAYPPRSARADVRRIAERLVELFVSMMPTLLHVLAHPDLRPSEMHKWHAQLPFAPIAHGLAARFRRMRADGLIAAIDAEAAASALIAVAHSVALLAVLMNEEHEAQRSARLRAMVDVVWSGLAPAAPVRG